ncbi:MAG TPA: hypothetical protein PKA00_20765 [Saprospiraceae bacterium]|nr:hypothetical protein [Saprospiraceae bacterium]HMQ85355.1 hypothetical protein [Saprospiraceae bacterium]
MEASKNHLYFLFALGLLCSGFLMLMSLPKSWEASVQQNEDGSYSLSKARQEAIDQKKERILQQEVYMLVAAENGIYFCKHCVNQNFFLYKGEVYKYGTTGNGKNGRGYSESWQMQNKLVFVHLGFGDESTVKIKQAELLGVYPLLPENMSRPNKGDFKSKPHWHRLVLPPGNTKLD